MRPAPILALPATQAGANDALGDLMATSTHGDADPVDARRITAEDPRPGVEAADALAGLVGMNELTLSQGLKEQIVSGTKRGASIDAACHVN